MFEEASRKKLRVNTAKGALSVEDMWDLPLTGNSTNLDDIAKNLYRKLDADNVKSFVVKDNPPDKILELKFNIVKHIIDTRVAEKELAEKAREARQKKQHILSIISRKQDQALEDTSLEDLQKMLEEL